MDNGRLTIRRGGCSRWTEYIARLDLQSSLTEYKDFQSATTINDEPDNHTIILGSSAKRIGGIVQE